MNEYGLDRLDDCYWVERGKLFAGEYPRTLYEESSREKLRALLRAGVRQFVDLTEPGELTHAGPLKPYDELLASLARGMGVAWAVERISIRDMSVPDPRTMQRILDTIDAAADAGLPVYVHCWGGFGRTGTVVGCWLLRHGRATRSTVLDTIAALRAGTAYADFSSPQTAEQCEFVRRWRER